MSSTSEPIRHGYSVIRAVLDDARGRSVPIGVVAWDADAEWYGIRSLTEGERLAGATVEVRTLAELAIEQIQVWVRRQFVPYGQIALVPWTSEFWVAASRVMTTAIRLDAPRSMDPLKDREAEFEALFEALVQPLTSRERSRKRIDGVVANALGRAAVAFQRSIDLPAFKGAHESVLRGVVGTHAAVVIEGVNLAAVTARKDADALVSRLLRIKAGPTRNVRFVVGYVTSPGGLNGETDMRDWIKEKVTDNVFDLISEEHNFQAAAIAELAQTGLAKSR